MEEMRRQAPPIQQPGARARALAYLQECVRQGRADVWYDLARVRIPTIAGSQTNRWRAADPTDRGQLRGWAVWFMPPLTGGCIVGAEVALVQAS